VQEKNFPAEGKITTNDTEEITLRSHQ